MELNVLPQLELELSTLFSLESLLARVSDEPENEVPCESGDHSEPEAHEQIRPDWQHVGFSCIQNCSWTDIDVFVHRGIPLNCFAFSKEALMVGRTSERVSQ